MQRYGFASAPISNGNVNEETIRKYIQEQEENDKLEDGRK